MSDCYWCTKETEYLKSTGKDFYIVNIESNPKAKKEMINKSHHSSSCIINSLILT